MYFLNELTAMIAIPLLVLGFRGFWPAMIRLLRSEAGTDKAMACLIAMILIVDVKGVLRMLWWDVIQPLNGGGVSSLEGTLINSSLNSMAALAGVMSLASLFYSIPPEERDGWSWISAPWYPNKLRIWFWRR